MPSDKNQAQTNLAEQTPKIGSRFKHFKGGEYEVIACAIKEDTLEPLVIYKNPEKGDVWARTLTNWNEEIDHGGQKIKRFTLLAE